MSTQPFETIIGTLHCRCKKVQYEYSDIKLNGQVCNLYHFEENDRQCCVTRQYDVSRFNVLNSGWRFDDGVHHIDFCHTKQPSFCMHVAIDTNANNQLHIVGYITTTAHTLKGELTNDGIVIKMQFQSGGHWFAQDNHTVYTKRAGLGGAWTDHWIIQDGTKDRALNIPSWLLIPLPPALKK